MHRAGTLRFSQMLQNRSDRESPGKASTAICSHLQTGDVVNITFFLLKSSSLILTPLSNSANCRLVDQLLYCGFIFRAKLMALCPNDELGDPDQLLVAFRPQPGLQHSSFC